MKQAPWPKQKSETNMEYPVRTGISTYFESDLAFFLSFLADPPLLLSVTIFTLSSNTMYSE